MELQILIDNLPCPTDPALQHEHGLSMLLTLGGKHYLIDTGASGKAMENLQTLKENNPNLPSVEEIDTLIISHGHNDHTGGLRRFFELNTTAPVYLHSSIQGNYFFSCRNREASAASPGIMEFRSIGMEQALFAENPQRFRHTDTPTAPGNGITLLPAQQQRNYPTPMGNEFLYKNDFPDDFSHELITLAEYAPSCYAVVSPCTHNGILNVLETCVEHIHKLSGRGKEECRSMIRHFVGGLHYVDYLKMEQGEKETASIIETVKIIKDMYPALSIFSGHCTCAHAGSIIKDILGNRYNTFYSGLQIFTARM